MTFPELIELKKRGHALTAEQLQRVVDGVTDGSVPDYQISAWLMAVWFRGLELEETYQLTIAMRDSGRVLRHDDVDRPTADKHSTGGVGDKVSLVLAPLAAELGLAVPMLSGRGLGHTGGTLDKLRSFDGYRIDLSEEEMHAQLAEIGCFINGQTGDVAPADRRLYALRDVTATVDCIPLIVSSILSKKLAAGPKHLVIDLKSGSGAFMRSLDDARDLADALLAVGTRAGVAMSALLTDMDQPLGRAVGHALECREAIDCLRGEGPQRVREISIELVTEMALLAGLGEADALRARCAAALDDGSALARFVAMARAQGARLDADDPAAGLDVAPERAVFAAPRAGHVRSMDAAAIGLSLLPLRGARATQDDELDLGTGVVVEVEIGDELQAGDAIARIHARDDASARACLDRLEAAIEVGDEPVDAKPLIVERRGA